MLESQTKLDGYSQLDEDPNDNSYWDELAQNLKNATETYSYILRYNGRFLGQMQRQSYILPSNFNFYILHYYIHLDPNYYKSRLFTIYATAQLPPNVEHFNEKLRSSRALDLTGIFELQAEIFRRLQLVYGEVLADPVHTLDAKKLNFIAQAFPEKRRDAIMKVDSYSTIIKCY